MKDNSMIWHNWNPLGYQHAKFHAYVHTPLYINAQILALSSFCFIRYLCREQVFALYQSLPCIGTMHYHYKYQTMNNAESTSLLDPANTQFITLLLHHYSPYTSYSIPPSALAHRTKQNHHPLSSFH